MFFASNFQTIYWKVVFFFFYANYIIDTVRIKNATDLNTNKKKENNEKILKGITAIAGIGAIAGATVGLTSCNNDVDGLPNIVATVKTDNLDNRVLDFENINLNKAGSALIYYNVKTSDKSALKSTNLTVSVYKAGSGLASTKIIGKASAVGDELEVIIKIGSSALVAADMGNYTVLITAVGYTHYVDPNTIRVLQKN